MVMEFSDCVTNIFESDDNAKKLNFQKVSSTLHIVVLIIIMETVFTLVRYENLCTVNIDMICSKYETIFLYCCPDCPSCQAHLKALAGQFWQYW